MTEEKNKKFLEMAASPDPAVQKFTLTLKAISEAWGRSLKRQAAFFLGARYGENARARALGGSDDPRLELAFELGLALGPELRSAGAEIWRALILAAVTATLDAIRTGKLPK